MPLNHDTATVSISVSGVSLGCLTDTGEWQLVFIREPTHTLAIEVNRQTEAGTEQVYPNTVIPVGCSITIEATGAIAPNSSLFMPAAQGDPEDFRLILDVEQTVYGGNKLDLKHPTLDVTQMTVPSAVLYSLDGKLSEFNVALVDQSGTKVAGLGKIGTSAGADITCGEGGSVTLKVDGPDGFELPLPRSAGVRYNIILDNNCPPVADANCGADDGVAARREALVSTTGKVSRDGLPIAPHSDFVLYYAILDVKDKGKFDLKKDDQDRGEGAVCNYSHLGITKNMFPLP